MVCPSDLSSTAPQLDDELVSLLFDPVDEWLVDPIDQSRSQSQSFPVLSSDKGMEGSGALFVEEMKRVKLEEVESEKVSGMKDSCFSMEDKEMEMEMVKVEEEKESENVLGVKDSSSVEVKEMKGVELEEEKESENVLGVKDSSSVEVKEMKGVELEEGEVVIKESEKMISVKDSSSSMEEKESAEVKAEESSSSSDEEPGASRSSEEEEDEEEEEEEEDSSDGESSSSSSESSEESSDEEKEREKGKEKENREGIEEGEMIIESDDEEGEEGFKGSAKSRNEIEDLPPVPKIDVQLAPHHHPSPIGEILSILGDRVIVEGSVKHNPLNEGSILWVTQTRSPLGLIDEVFGPVKSPFYLIRYNSDKDVPPGISVGTAVSFVPEFASHVLNNNKDLYKKGYDMGDEEIDDEVAFSDDEKEAEYKRALRQAKRGSNNSNEKPPGPVKSSRRNVNSQKKGDGNFTSRFSHPIAQPPQQNQLAQNQFQQNQFPQNQLQQNQFFQNQLPQNQFPHNQLPQNQFPQNQFLQNQLPQNQLQQNQLLQNQLLVSLLASGMQIPGFGLPMNPNPNPNPFLFGGNNFPPSNMQFNPGNMQFNPANMPNSGERPPMQGNMQFNPSNMPNSGERQPMQGIMQFPPNVSFNAERPPMQFQPENLSMGGQSGNLQSSPGSSSFRGERPVLQFNPGNSASSQFNPGNSEGECLNLQFSPRNFSNRGRRGHQRGRGGRHFSGRNGNARPRNG